MKKNHLVKYLLISPSLPVGGFCYSEGLESYLKIKNLALSPKFEKMNSPLERKSENNEIARENIPR